MPDHGEFQNNASPKNLEEAVWRLKVEDSNGEGLDVQHQNPYPDRPGAPDCLYYLRTGLCGYGNNCRYNHPSYNGQGTQDGVELPERVGQPECQVDGWSKHIGNTCLPPSHILIGKASDDDGDDLSEF